MSILQIELGTHSTKGQNWVKSRLLLSAEKFENAMIMPSDD